MKTGTEAQSEDLLECDAVALGSYDAFSYMGGGVEDFHDRAYYPMQGQVTDKPYAAFVTHGGGGRAIESIKSIAKSSKLRKIANAVLIKAKHEGKGLADLKELGARLAAVTGKWSPQPPTVGDRRPPRSWRVRLK